MTRDMIKMIHKQSGKTALAIRAPSACVLVQFDELGHKQSHGWHLYPRSVFKVFREKRGGFSIGYLENGKESE